MANKACINRLQKEYRTLLKEPVPHITSHPSPNNLLEWHFVLEGAAGTEFERGVYHGKIVFPPAYPFKPPSISLFTPNGRFATNTKLCLSMTDYHPESWNPMWSVGTILTGLLSFMYDSQQTTGSITTSKAEKERFAADSLAFNVKNPTFRKLFPEWMEEQARRLAAVAAAEQAAAAAARFAASAQQHPSANGCDALHIGQNGGDVNSLRCGSAAAGDAAAAGRQPNSSWFTAVVVVLILAIAIVPLLGGKSGLLPWLGHS